MSKSKTTIRQVLILRSLPATPAYDRCLLVCGRATDRGAYMNLACCYRRVWFPRMSFTQECGYVKHLQLPRRRLLALWCNTLANRCTTHRELVHRDPKQ